uniref:Secreted protein n=1 Tax=Triticum urartu TaxID=4572 RepID=A0A8R7Q4S1_TRIUA
HRVQWTLLGIAPLCIACERVSKSLDFSSETPRVLQLHSTAIAGCCHHWGDSTAVHRTVEPPTRIVKSFPAASAHTCCCHQIWLRTPALIRRRCPHPPAGSTSCLGISHT